MICGVTAKRQSLCVHFTDLIPAHVGWAKAQFAEIVRKRQVLSDIIGGDKKRGGNPMLQQDWCRIFVIIEISIVESDRYNRSLAVQCLGRNDVFQS